MMNAIITGDNIFTQIEKVYDSMRHGFGEWVHDWLSNQSSLITPDEVIAALQKMTNTLKEITLTISLINGESVQLRNKMLATLETGTYKGHVCRLICAVANNIPDSMRNKDSMIEITEYCGENNRCHVRVIPISSICSFDVYYSAIDFSKISKPSLCKFKDVLSVLIKKNTKHNDYDRTDK